MREPGQGAFLAGAAVLFAASTTLTVACCLAMSGMGGTPMPGGGSTSMAWVRMCGQSWADAAATFLGMWVVMMVAMMLPSLAPMLWRYRQAAAGAGATRPGRLTVLVGLGYFCVWILLGVVVFPMGVAAVALQMESPALARAAPAATAAVVLLAGALQFTAWKARQLACAQQPPAQAALRADAGTAWRHGLRLGLQCCACCAGLTAILLAVGVMDLRVMAAVTAAITFERLAPAGEWVARGIGALSLGAGVLLLARAAWP